MMVQLTPGSRTDYDEILNWYTGQGTQLALSFSSDFLQFLQRVLSNPRLYAAVKHTPRGREVRQGTLSRFPYQIYYEITPIEIVILSLTHTSRKRTPWRRRLP